jgi:hypothetical protein
MARRAAVRVRRAIAVAKADGYGSTKPIELRLKKPLKRYGENPQSRSTNSRAQNGARRLPVASMTNRRNATSSRTTLATAASDRTVIALTPSPRPIRPSDTVYGVSHASRNSVERNGSSMRPRTTATCSHMSVDHCPFAVWMAVSTVTTTPSSG